MRLSIPLFTVALFVSFAFAMQASQPAFSSFPGANGKLAFSDSLGGLAAISTINPDGTDRTRLFVPGTGDDTDPTWGPNGNLLAFSRSEPRETIGLARSDGVILRTRLAGLINASDPDWSPDGSRLVVTGRVFSSYDLFTMTTEGTDLVRLTNTGHNASPDWSPDGSQIVFHCLLGGLNLEICRVPAAGGPVTYLTENDSLDSSPTWSPDGKHIVFFSNRSGNNDIYSMDADGLNVTRLTNSPASDAGPEWSPDGTKIAFSSDRGNANDDLYLMNPDGTNQTVLAGGIGNQRYPDWQRVVVGAPSPGGGTSPGETAGAVLGTGPTSGTAAAPRAQRLPRARTSNITVREGQTARIPVRLDVLAALAARLQFRTVGQSASSAMHAIKSAADFRARQGSVAIRAGQNIAMISIKTLKDNIVEPTERFLVRLSNASGLSLARSSAQVSILDSSRKSQTSPRFTH